jgi:hypothetical protein
VILDNSSSGTIAENASNGIDVHANGNIFVTNSGTLAARGNLGEGVAANGNVTLTNSGTVMCGWPPAGKGFFDAWGRPVGCGHVCGL